MAKLMYGCGLRLNEGIRLRVNSLDLERNLVHIRAAKSDEASSAGQGFSEDYKKCH